MGGRDVGAEKGPLPALVSRTSRQMNEPATSSPMAAVAATAPCSVSLLQRIGSKHGAEQGTLLDCVVQRAVGVRQVIEPGARHGALSGGAVVGAQQRHRVGLEVQRRVGKWARSCEAN